MRKSAAVAAIALSAVAALHLTGVGTLVWRSAVRDRGEGGPAFDCYYLGTGGPVRIGYFHSDAPERERTSPAPRADCPWVCGLEKTSVRVGAREIAAWRCTADRPAPEPGP